MDDCDIEPTPNDPEFDPYECESTYALWAFKEEGEPVKFLEASLVENPDCPSGYSFCWRTLSLCDRTGKLVDRFGGDIGDVSRADYIADTVLREEVGGRSDPRGDSVAAAFHRGVDGGGPGLLQD